MNVSNRPDINQLLLNMRDIKSQVQAPSQSPAALDVADGISRPGLNVQDTTPAFGELFNKAIDNVNGLQQNASALSSAYARGDESVDITDVMIASEKSRVGFQATVQVRNKVIEAYQDIMNMPI
ncbi:flagellar hook-basal body complex protein FliE [Halioxenophilus aromaticivorans]|uniref:Flagellar hook-basal body complex protein FliE n=1 Tax=Halioxenophilus aromaticivorans TaxID=1306992 RepID=A0AAV3U0B6_9ALTE